MADATVCPQCGASGNQFCASSVGTPLPVEHDARTNARQPQLPSDDGLIKALERCRDKFREYAQSHAAKARDWLPDAEFNDRIRKSAANREMADMCDEALSRHKAPLSVAKEKPTCEVPYCATFGCQSGAPHCTGNRSLSVAGDDVERVPPIGRPPYCKPHEWLLLSSYCGDDNDDCTERRPCADCLAMCNVFDERGKFLRELGALTALQVAEGDKVERQLLKRAMLALRGRDKHFQTAVAREIEAALHSQQEGEG